MSLFTHPVWSYIGKVILISGILYGYYRVFLRNGAFHSYNRWFLLGSAGLALVLPWIRLPIWTRYFFEPVYTVQQPVGPGTVGGPVVPVSPAVGWGEWWGVNTLYIGYGIGIVLFAYFLLRSLRYLWKLSRRYPFTRREGIRFFETGEPGTPFSFMDRLFWNRDLPVDSEAGRSIFRHELYHIRQRHTQDLLVLEVLRCLFWINPFFHLILRELKVVHEFLADRYALAGEEDREAGSDKRGAADRDDAGGGRDDDAGTGSRRQQYAEFLVWRSVRGVHTPAIAHPFFHTPLKRRITMILQSTPTPTRLISRWMALPLIVALVALTAGSSAEPRKAATHKPLTFKVEPLIRYYMRHIRYPSATLKAGQEGKLSFTIRVGENHQMLAFNVQPGDGSKGADVKEIVVTSRPDGAGNTQLTAGQSKAIFTEELTRVSQNLSQPDTAAYMAAIQPGTYHFRIVFKIEKSGTAAAGSQKPGSGQRVARSIRPDQVLIAYAKNPGLEKYFSEKIRARVN